MDLGLRNSQTTAPNTKRFLLPNIMQLQRAGPCSRVSRARPILQPGLAPAVRQRVCCAASPQQQQSSEPSTSAPAAEQQQSAEIKREFTALGSKVVESNLPFKGPEDEKDFWEGDQFDAFGKALENYFVPGLIALGLVCGGIAAKTYNDGATAFVKPPTGPDAEPSIIIAIPEAGQSAPSPRS